MVWKVMDGWMEVGGLQGEMEWDGMGCRMVGKGKGKGKGEEAGREGVDFFGIIGIIRWSFMHGCIDA